MKLSEFEPPKELQHCFFCGEVLVNEPPGYPAGPLMDMTFTCPNHNTQKSGGRKWFNIFFKEKHTRLVFNVGYKYWFLKH